MSEGSNVSLYFQYSQLSPHEYHMKILHLAPHEVKFVVVAAEIFDTCDGIENQFLVLARDVRASNKFFANRKNIRVESPRYIHTDSFAKELMECDCLVVHFMDGIKAQAIMQAPKNLPVVWSGWGGDYYDLMPEGGRNLFGDSTRQFLRVLDRNVGWSTSQIMGKLKNVIRKIRNAVLYAPQIEKAIKRVDFFSAPFPEDFELLKKHFGKNFNPSYTRVFYGSVERTYVPGVESVYGNNILVGNSATATNNHLEVFELLSKLDLGDRKIIVPLSYGDMAYRDAIITRGRALFGERFEPIVDFMPLEQYNTLIAQCSTVIMGHRRQQGGGNTVTMLFKGAKVFLDEANTVYQYLKNRGAFVFTLKDLQVGNADVFEPLTNEQKRKNQEVLYEYAGNEVVLRGVCDFVEQIRAHGVIKGE